MKTISLIIIGCCILVVFNSFVIQNNEWLAPKSEADKKNPIESNEKSLKLGKKIYDKMCWTCHGNEGKGDGPAATALNPKPAAFTESNFQLQKDGALFWKIKTGRGTMVSYENSLTEDQRWAVINYLRTFKK